MSLVAGTSSFALAAMPSSTDPSRSVVGYRDAGGNLLEFSETTFRDGELGGLMTFRRETLDRTQNQLGQMAVALAVAFNEQHGQGVDLNGQPGQAFFSVGQPISFSHALNTSSAALKASYDPAALGQLRSTDYQVSWSAADGYRVQALDSGELLAVDTDADGALLFGGLRVEVNGTPAEGDRFLLQPTRYSASQMRNQLTDISQIAAGLPDGGSGSGDNRNALKLQALQNQALVGGKATFSQGYAAMVSDIGNQANIVKGNLAVQQGLGEQLRAMQQAESGVNLDEEAANLIRYQQFYQANAKVIEIGASVIDTLLGIRA